MPVSNAYTYMGEEEAGRLMGCWNETCAVSGLPVAAGDAVRVLLVKRSPCPDAGDLPWLPLGPAIDARYDEYGGFAEADDTPALRFAMDYFARTLGVNALDSGEDLSHLITHGKGATADGPVDAALLDAYALCFVHAQAYTYVSGVSDRRAARESDLTSVLAAYDRWAETDRMVRDAARARIAAVAAHGADPPLAVVASAAQDARDLVEMEQHEIGRSGLFDVERLLWDTADRAALARALVADRALADPILDLLCFQRGLVLLRRMLLPQGVHDQETRYQVHVRFAGAVADLARQLRRQHA